jgi:regulatory protein
VAGRGRRRGAASASAGTNPEAPDVPDDPQLAGPPGDPESVARTICLRQLDRRARTRAELADTLGRRGIPDEAAERVLDRFVEVGLIDDAGLADGFAQAQHQERGLSGRAVAMKLRRRGVAEESVQAAVAGIDRGSEVEVARRLVERKLRSADVHQDSVALTRRLVGLLARKGYAPGLTYDVVRTALAERAEAGDVDLDAAIAYDGLG